MPFQSEKQRRFLHANHPEIAKRWERDYGEGGIAALNAQLNQLPEYYLPAAHGGRIGFHRGSLRHQKEHDYKAYEDEGNFMKYLMLSGDRAKMSSPENVINRLVNPKMGYTQKRDDFETWQKERFMYGEKKDPLINLSKSELDKKINTWLKDLFAKKNGEDFIDDEELNLVKGGIANHFKKRVTLQDSVESLSDTEFQTMYPDWDPNQFTREEYLQFISENEGNGVLDLRTDDEAIEVASTEENEIIPDLLTPGSAAGILRLKDGGRIGFFTGMREAEQKQAAREESRGAVGRPTPQPVRHHAVDTPAQTEEQRVIDRDKLARIADEDNELVGWHPDAEKKAQDFRDETVIKVLKRKDLTKEEKKRQLKYHWEEAKKAHKTVKDLKTAMAISPIVGMLAGVFMMGKAKKT